MRLTESAWNERGEKKKGALAHTCFQVHLPASHRRIGRPRIIAGMLKSAGSVCLRGELRVFLLLQLPRKLEGLVCSTRAKTGRRPACELNRGRTE